MNQTTVVRRIPRRDLLMCLTGLVVLASAAAADSLLDARLHDPAFLSGAANVIARVPADFGDWTSQPGQISEREMRLAEIDAAVRREYRHANSGYSVTMTLLSGASGPMSVHPPTACFEGVGYTLSSGPSTVTVTDEAGQIHAFNTASFREPNSSLPEVVRVFWGWTSDGHWDAPENPRLTYRGQPGLFKLYVVDRAASGRSDLKQAETFLEDVLAQLAVDINAGTSRN